MSTPGSSEAYGFKGLTSLVSDFKQPSLSTAASTFNASRPASPLAHEKTVPSTVQGRDYGRGPIALVVIVGVLGFIAYANMNNDSTRSTPANVSTPTAGLSNITPLAEAPRSAFDPATDGALVEAQPAPGSNMVLTRREIYYCLAQDSRISAVQALLDRASHSEIMGYNAVVADFNSRCSQYRYKEADMAHATAAVKAHQAEIEREAQQWLATWQGPKRGRAHSNINVPKSSAE